VALSGADGQRLWRARPGEFGRAAAQLADLDADGRNDLVVPDQVDVTARSGRDGSLLLRLGRGGSDRFRPRLLPAAAQPTALLTAATDETTLLSPLRLSLVWSPRVWPPPAPAPVAGTRRTRRSR
jgi:hypothetical protein